MSEIRGCKKINYCKISQKFISYLEKHRIYELFQELSAMLLIKKPDDHVLFLKQSLYHAARRLDAPRIIILASPEFNKLSLAKNLKAKLGIPLIKYDEIIGRTKFEQSLNANFVVEKLKEILMEFMKINYDGWILFDFPNSEEEARALIRAGIIPSHVFEIITPDILAYSLNSSHIFQHIYYKNIRGLRHILSKFIKKINTENKNFKNVADECAKLVKCRTYFQAPKTYRILLIDFVDWMRYKCLGPYIANVFNINHIDFSEISKQMYLQETALGDILREITNDNLSPELKIQIFKQFLLQADYCKKGWILTGFCKTINDLKHLDMTDSPPNRIIIIMRKIEKECDKDDSTDDSEKSCCNCDRECVLFSKQEIQDILNYIGESAIVIDDHEDLKVIKENINSCLMQPPLCVPPRLPRAPSAIKLEDIEFDPDDEPNTEIFNDIREPEPLLPLI